MFKIGDVVRIIGGFSYFIGREGEVVSMEDGFVQVLIFGYIINYDFLPQELEHV